MAKSRHLIHKTKQKFVTVDAEQARQAGWSTTPIVGENLSQRMAKVNLAALSDSDINSLAGTLLL